MRSTMILAGTALAGLLGTTPASAEMVTYRGIVSPSAEVPPVTNSKGTGTVEATYDTGTRQLAYQIGYTDLTGPAAAAHFHGPAPAGKNAPVMVPINGSLASPIKGTATLTDDQAKALANGDLYFNVHTPTNKNGEMRGQLVKVK